MTASFLSIIWPAIVTFWYIGDPAEQIIVLTESDKFSKRGVVPLNLKEKIKTVITDHSIDSSYVQELNNQNIQVITI